jgi:hypothetical protein
MHLPRMRITIWRMMAVVALVALVLGVWKWTHRYTPTPQARALELALSVPTTSDYEATAIYRAAIHQEQISPGTLTLLAQLPKIQTSRLGSGLLATAWEVEFTDRASGKAFQSRCIFTLRSVNEFQAFARTGIPPASPPPKGRLIGSKPSSKSETSR